MAGADKWNYRWAYVTDREYSKHLSRNPNTISRYNNLSNVSVFTLIGSAGGMWLLSHANHNDHWRETGLLAGEAALNSFVVVEGFKYPLGRQRPFRGMAAGLFPRWHIVPVGTRRCRLVGCRGHCA